MRRDDDLWAGVVDQSQWDMLAFKWLTSQPAVTAGLESDIQPRRLLCFIIFSRFLVLNSQVACVTNKHPLSQSSYKMNKAHVLLPVEIATRIELVKVLNPYTYYLRKYILLI